MQNCSADIINLQKFKKYFQRGNNNVVKLTQQLTNELKQKAKSLIPGLSQLLSKRPDMFSADVWPTYFKKAQGVHVWDLDDNCFIDMSISGIGANILGYAIPEINQPVIQAIENGVSSSLNCAEDVYLAEKLIELHPWAEQVRFTRCGGEAMAVAVRIARAATGKDKIAFCGYHGWHDWYLAANVASNNGLDQHLIAGLAPTGVPKALQGTAVPFDFNNIEMLRDILKNHSSEMAAVVMEPMRYQIAKPNYWSQVQKLCQKYKLPLIIDEISMGFRLNCGGSHLVLGIEPDIAVFSKALANGHPMAAIIGKSKWMEAAQNSFISSTMWTERVGPVAALACINFYQKKSVYEHLAKIGKLVQDGWQEAADNNGLTINIMGIPALCHFTIECCDFLSIKSYFIQLMLEQGYLASNVFYAMYSHQIEHVEGYIEAVNHAFAKVKHAIDTNTFDRKVTPTTSGFKRLN
jgi:glutamate-1-semialdehyde 2,1-aminomutase